jgi:phosphoglycolate phosphatase-like HAD superfamily hydrolase
VFNAVINVPFVPGAQEFLENYHEKIPLYVVSATPEEELLRIIRMRAMSQYFRKVFGAPRKKTDCINEILVLTGSPPDTALFVGDARNDFEAARASGVRFIGRIRPGDKNRFSGLAAVETIIQDLCELSEYIGVHQ